MGVVVVIVDVVVVVMGVVVVGDGVVVIVKVVVVLGGVVVTVWVRELRWACIWVMKILVRRANRGMWAVDAGVPGLG